MPITGVSAHAEKTRNDSAESSGRWIERRNSTDPAPPRGGEELLVHDPSVFQHHFDPAGIQIRQQHEIGPLSRRNESAVIQPEMAGGRPAGRPVDGQRIGSGGDRPGDHPVDGPDS